MIMSSVIEYLGNENQEFGRVIKTRVKLIQCGRWANEIVMFNRNTLNSIRLTVIAQINQFAPMKDTIYY